MQHDLRLRAAARAIYDNVYPPVDTRQFGFYDAERVRDGEVPAGRWCGTGCQVCADRTARAAPLRRDSLDRVLDKLRPPGRRPAEPS
jgi:hypothetical protein